MRLHTSSVLLGVLVSFLLAIPSATLAGYGYGDKGYGKHNKGKKPNIIVILADDYGKDSFSLLNPTMEDGPTNAPVPSLGKLADKGVIFKNGWAMPTCSVTRGTRTTGLLPSTTGMGRVVGQFTPRIGAAGPFEGVEYPPTMINPNNKNLIQKLMKKAGYETIKLGKWHETQPSVPNNPDVVLADATADIVASGFDHFIGFSEGTIPNHGGTDSERGGDYDLLYSSDESGTRVNRTVTTNEFAASFFVSRAIDFINKNKSQNDKPFYMALDFAAPHWIFSPTFPPRPPLSDGYQVAPGPNEPAPTDTLNNPFGPVTDWRTLTDADGYESVIDDVEAAYGGSYPDAGTVSGAPGGARAIAAFKSKIAYMDLQIGRLLENVDLSNTYVMFIGDNGTQGGAPFFNVVEAPFDSTRSKGTLYRNGVEVPYIIAGPHIRKPGRISDALVTTTDVLATVTHIAGIKQPRKTRRESISAVPALLGRYGWRRYNVAEGYNTQASVGGISAGPSPNDGRVVADKRFRLIAKPKIVAGAFVCKDSFVPSGDDPLLDAECLNQTTGIYEKQHNLEFYDIKNDKFENNALTKEEMSYKQWYSFKRLCRELNKISRKATYFQNGKVCKRNGSNLIDIDPS